MLHNLALACVSCSLRKGARTHATDPLTEEIVEVFSPREHRWDDHFEVTAAFLIVGKTALGRGTVDLLKLNRPMAVAIRHEEALRDRYP